MILQDIHNIRRLSLNIKLICTRCETGWTMYVHWSISCCICTMTLFLSKMSRIYIINFFSIMYYNRNKNIIWNMRNCVFYHVGHNRTREKDAKFEGYSNFFGECLIWSRNKNDIDAYSIGLLWADYHCIVCPSLIYNRIDGVKVNDWVKPKTIKLVFIASPLSTQN